MNINSEYKINSLQDLQKLADKIKSVLKVGSSVVLNGDLGTGKTTLVKFICEKYNIFNVSSPSFSIVNEYYGDIKVYHFDFYRLKKIEELYDIGFEEYLMDSEAIVFIEWGNLMNEILPEDYIEINISFAEANSRIIKILENN